MTKGRPGTKVIGLLVLLGAWFSTPEAVAQTGVAVTAASPSSRQDVGPPGAGGPGAPEEETPQAPAEAAPLSGARVLTPGPRSEVQSYFLPSFQWTFFANSNPSSTSDTSTTAAQNTLVGNLTLQRVRRNSQLNLEYAGGAVLYSGGGSDDPRVPGPANGTFHRLGFSQTVRGHRWELAVSDQLTFLPESPFGFAGFGGLSSFGSGLGGSFLANGPVLNPTLEPNQTILAPRARRLGNTALAEVQYAPSPRSSVTATTAYGNLHFMDVGFLDSSFWKFMTGYNYAVTRLDTLAVSYSQTRFYFGLDERNVVNHGFLTTYGRKLTGRLSLQLSAGPLFSRIAQGPGNSKTRVLWDTYDSLQYRLRRGHVEVSFSRFTNTGAGVLTGAESNVATFSLGHQFSRKAFGSLSFGHAYNQSLAPESELEPRSKFKTLYGGFNVSRELGERTSIYFVYHVQRQDSNVALCSGSSCGEVLLRHVVGVGFNWHGRPIRLD